MADEWKDKTLKGLTGEVKIFESYFMSEQELLSENFPPVKRYFHPWLAEGTMNMIVGPKGGGKTTLGEAISIALTRPAGTVPIGPWKTKEAVGVAYVDGENSPRVVQDKIRLFTANLPPPVAPFKIFLGNHYARLEGKTINLLYPEDRTYISAALVYNPLIKVLILDNMSCLSLGRDELDKAQWDPINQWLLELKSQGITTILMAHAGKDARLGARGTSGMGDSMDCIIMLSKPKDYHPNDKCFFQVGYDKNPRVIDIDDDLSSFTFKLNKDLKGGLVWTSEVKPDDDDDMVLNCLIIDMYRSSRNQTDIAKMLNISQGKVSKRKSELIKNKFIDDYGRPEQKGLDFIESFDFSKYYGEEAPF